MKLLKTLSLLSFALATTYASSRNYEITYYGCPDECGTQKNPSCSKFKSGLPTYFAALSTGLSHYDDYCGEYAIYMMADGSSSKLAKATIVDSCTSCPKYHLDLSVPAFTSIREKKHGVGRVIWGVYSRSGSRLAGPFYDSVSGSASKFGMSESALIASFDANAKKLASSGSSSRSLNSSDASSDVKPAEEHHTTKKSTSRVVPKTTLIPQQKTTLTQNPKIISTTTKTLPFGTASKTLINSFPTNTPLVNVTVTTSKVPSAPKQTPSKQNISQVIDEEKDKDGDSVGTTIGIIAAGAGCLGAAGAGLVFLKKKNPSTYEGMKQKFPEAFSNVKRGLTRSATSIKRRVTRKPSPYVSTNA